jgi:hypothetical protein
MVGSEAGCAPESGVEPEISGASHHRSLSFATVRPSSPSASATVERVAFGQIHPSA